MMKKAVVTNSNIQARRLRWAGHVVRMEKDRSTFKIFTGKLIERYL